MQKLTMKKMLTRTFVTACATAMLLATTAQADTLEHQLAELARYSKYAGPPIDAFPMFSVWQTQIVGKQNVLVWTELKKVYLIKVDKSCSRLDWAHGFSLTQNMMRRVTKEFDFVNIAHQQCKIIEIRQVDYPALLRDDRAAEGAPPAKS